MSAHSDIEARLARLEAESAIRSLMARYFTACEDLGPHTDVSRISALYTEDAIWRGKGSRYAEAFGEHRGRRAIEAMMTAHSDPPHFAMNAHFFTSEAIEVDGDAATGRWMMLQTSTYTSGTSDLRSARLTVDFARKDGSWRISRFETENIFSRPVDRWDTSDPVPVPKHESKELL